jgi:hypothetical protein
MVELAELYAILRQAARNHEIISYMELYCRRWRPELLVSIREKRRLALAISWVCLVLARSIFVGCAIPRRRW